MGSPSAGAGELIFTRPVTALPPATVAGLKVNSVRVGALTARLAFAELSPIEPVMVATVLTATGVVAIEKVAVVFPFAITTDELTVAEEVEDASITIVPVVPAF